MFVQMLSRALFAVVSAGVLSLSAPAMAGAPTTYTAVSKDGVKLAVQESGNPDGPAIIFIHGLLGSRLNWDGQVQSPALRGYRLITYDLRGHGLSDKPSDAASYHDGRRWADDLNAVIKASKASKPVVVGWSLGGVVISNYLAAYGDKDIAGAVYVDGVVELTADQIVAHPDVYTNMNASDLKTHLDGERTFVGLCFNHQPDTDTFSRLLANAAMASWEMQREIPTMTVFAEQGLGNAHVPLLFIYGGKDSLVQPHRTIARATALNPRIVSKIYDESGHAPFVEETERFNGDLARFVNAVAK